MGLSLTEETLTLCGTCYGAVAHPGATCRSCELAAGAAERPAHIGPFPVERLLGEGALGRVWGCSDAAGGRRVAVRTLPGDPAEIALAERYLREARAAARVHHPNVVATFAVGKAHGAPFVVVEHAGGTTLASLLRTRGPLEPGEALPLVRDAARALAAAAEHGVVHGDVRPGNLFLTAAGGVKLGDFGFAPPLDAAPAERRRPSGFGTPAYMSPEQAQGQPADHRSDVYALGITLWELLSGSTPFTDPDIFALLVKHVVAPLPDPAAALPPLPEPVLALLRRMTAKDPAARPTCDEVLVTLQAAVDAMPVERPHTSCVEGGAAA